MAAPAAVIKQLAKERPKELVLRPMNSADEAQVATQFVKAFQREPIGARMGVSQKEGNNIAAEALKDNVSYVVEDPRRPKGSEIIAFRASKLLARDEMEELARTPPATHPVPAILNHLMVAWYKESTIFKKNVDAKVMKWIALGVDDEYEGMGLAKELLQASLDKAQELQCDGIVVIASAFATQHLFANRLGFERIVQLRYEDFEMWTDEEGGRKYPFEGLTQPEFIEVYEKQLK